MRTPFNTTTDMAEEILSHGRRLGRFFGYTDQQVIDGLTQNRYEYGQELLKEFRAKTEAITPTAKQLGYIRKLERATGSPRADLDGITREQASDLIFQLEMLDDQTNRRNDPW